MLCISIKCLHQFHEHILNWLQVLAAVIKAGASREHEILAEIKDSVFSFIRKMEPKRVMDTMLVSRVRILYIRSLLARSPELQSIKVITVEAVGFLFEKKISSNKVFAVYFWDALLSLVVCILLILYVLHIELEGFAS